MMVVQRRAFTMVELLVVVAVIATLASIIIPIVSVAMANAARNQTRSLLAKVASGIESYKQDWGRYPICAGFAAADWTAVRQSNQWLRTELVSTDKNIHDRNRPGYLAGVLKGREIADGAILDRWGNPLIFVSRMADKNWPATFTPYRPFINLFELWSAGPDGAFNTLRGTAAGDPDTDNLPATVYDPAASNQQF